MSYQFADFHCDTLLKIYLREMDFGKLNDFAHIDLPRLREANHVFQTFAVFFDPRMGQEAALRQTLRMIDLAKTKIFTQPGMTLVTKAKDVETIDEGNIAGLLAIEGADFIGDDLFLVDLVYDMGVRLITLTWNGRNTLADGVKVLGSSGGLTEMGIDAVKRMQELGIIVDVAHLSEAGFWDVSKLATRPFVASHSNAKAICDHPRNLTDDQIKEIAKHKGLIGMNLCPPFISTQEDERTLTTLVRHISHIADLVGVDTLCLGADLDGIVNMPTGMKDVRDVPRIAELLADAGFLPEEIQKICGDNLIKFVHNYLG